ncbi:unnamed protein product [Oikopleura dioica]|uniref:Uncharacterized protein n=1 Tax=Oikopleura dioica TaxID=34765 RepID=E4YIY8_OIKDI|nr:unnamed protein product [Oikopleura dioica]
MNRLARPILRSYAMTPRVLGGKPARDAFFNDWNYPDGGHSATSLKCEDDGQISTLPFGSGLARRARINPMVTFLNEFIFILWAGLLISVPWFFMRLGMRKTIGDPEPDNLPEGFTSTVTTTSGMLGSYLSNFNVEVNSFTKANTLGLSGLMYYIDKWTVLNKESKHVRAEWRKKRKAVWANLKAKKQAEITTEH